MKILSVPALLHSSINPDNCEIIKKAGAADWVYVILDNGIQCPLIEGSLAECEEELNDGIYHGIFNFNNPGRI